MRKWVLASIAMATLICASGATASSERPQLGPPTGATVRGACTEQYADSTYAGHFEEVLFPNGGMAIYICRATLQSGSSVDRPVEQFTAGKPGTSVNELLIVLPANPMDFSDTGRLILVEWPAQ